ncbi:MAG: DUF4389 domain-containing protein [Kineosporiaceae bacterium]
MATTSTYPVHLQASLDPPLSRWLWLVKWLLIIPHYVVLAFLWMAFCVASVASFFAILATGRYPRALFDFNVGVLRWTWRVSYYGYGALGTDQYPPFSLADVPHYPARLTVDYPEHLSRGLVLVKWWLLAIPHYVIVGLFVGGGAWLGWRADDWQWSWGGGGLVGVLVLVSAVVLTATGSYPGPLFDVIVGLNRWVLRVAGYAALMTDAYPPFRLDLGGQDPDGALASTEPPVPSASGGGRSTSYLSGLGGGTPAPVDPWTGGRVVSLVVGGLLALTAIGVLTAGGATLWADRTQRDAAGYLTSPAATFSTAGRGLASESIAVHGGGPNWAYPRSVLGETRLRFSSDDPTKPLFVGVAPTPDAARYLSGVQYTTVTDFADTGVTYVQHGGDAPSVPPQASDIWVAEVSGPGTQTLTWSPDGTDSTIVVMNLDGSAGVSVRADAGATLPLLPWVAAGLLIGGLVALLVGIVLIAVAVSGVAPSDPARERVRRQQSRTGVSP